MILLNLKVRCFKIYECGLRVLPQKLCVGKVCLLCLSSVAQLSPALRNRFTEIWCPQSNTRSDLVQIVQHNLRSGLSLDGKLA